MSRFNDTTNILPGHGTDHNPVSETFRLLELFDVEGVSLQDHPQYAEPSGLYFQLNYPRGGTEKLRQLIRGSRANYYALESLFRVWLCVTVADYSTEEAAEIFNETLCAVYPTTTRSHAAA